MALFAVNTGCRDAEVCSLRWDWEVQVPELGTSVFIIPGWREKRRRSSRGAQQRRPVGHGGAGVGNMQRYVFTYKGKPMRHMLKTAWKRRGRVPGSIKSAFTISNTPSAGGCGQRRRLRGSARPARSPVRTDNNALLGSRTVPVDRGSRSECGETAGDRNWWYFVARCEAGPAKLPQART